MADTLLLGLLTWYFVLIVHHSAALNATTPDSLANDTHLSPSGNSSNTEAHRANSKPLFSSLPSVTKVYSLSNSTATRSSSAYGPFNQYDHHDHHSSSGATALLVIVILVGLTSIVMGFLWARYRRIKRNRRDLRYHYTSLDQTIVISPCSSPELQEELLLSFKGHADSSDDEELLQ